jgi:hypothetical protein
MEKSESDFAPGGKGSRFLARSAPRFSWSGDCDSAFRDRGSRRRSSGPAAGRGGASPAPAPAAPVPAAGRLGGKGTLPRPASPEGLRAGPALGWTLPGEVHPLLLLGPPSGSPPAGPALATAAQSPVSSEVAGSARRGRFKVMWLPRGSCDPSLGFVASSWEVRRRACLLPLRSLLRTHPLPHLFDPLLRWWRWTGGAMMGETSTAWTGMATTAGGRRGGRWQQHQEGYQGYPGFQGYQEPRFQERFPEPPQRDNWGRRPPGGLRSRSARRRPRRNPGANPSTRVPVAAGPTGAGVAPMRRRGRKRRLQG